MAYNETNAAAQVLSREITLTRRFFDRVRDLIAPALARITAKTAFGTGRNKAGQDVYEDLYYPNESLRRS